jgi:anti-sigma regulatory factor (Ser/Thr protein kinase)
MPVPEASATIATTIAESADVLVACHAAEGLAEAAGFTSIESAEIGLVVRELASNIIKYAGSGTLTVAALDNGLEVVAEDAGPGIPDVQRAVADGYSTVNSLGYGLGTVNRLMDDMIIRSTKGEGTTIQARRSHRAPDPVGSRCPLDIGVATIPKPGYPENGDSFVVRTRGTRTLAGVIDGVGHGAPAHTAAQAARRYVETHADQPLDAVFRGTGVACRGTRGAVMALARIDWASWTIEFASVGNIESRVMGVDAPINFVVRRGIIGVNAPAPRVTMHPWPPQATLILHSDGVVSHWGPNSLAERQNDSAASLARFILHELNRGNDDATVIVVKGAQT